MMKAALVLLLAIAIGVAALLHCRDRGVPPEQAGPGAASPGRARLLELRQQAPAALAGSVQAAGAPIVATVCVRAGRPTGSAARCTTSDVRGAYAFDQLQPGAYAVWASAPGFAGGQWRGPAPDFEASLWLAASERRTAVALVLLAGAVEVRGIVREVRGGTIAGALIHVTAATEAAPSFTTRSAADGSFVAWAAAGPIHVTASADGFVDAEQTTAAPVERVELVLTPGSSLAGVVVEAGTRRPIAAATVSVWGTSAISDANGRFRLAKLPPGRYKPTAASLGGYGETAESVLVRLGQSVEDLVIEVHPVAVVVGRVVIEDGSATRPCPPDQGGVTLTRYGSAAFYRTRTDLDGAILLEGVVPGTYAVTAWCTRFLARFPYPELEVRDSDVDDLAWSVTPGARVAGHVVTVARTPIAEAVINLRSSNGASFTSAQSAPDGSFVADGLPPGAVELIAHAEGFVRAAGRSSVIAALGTIASIDLVFETGGSITGEVVDATGKPGRFPVEAAGGGQTWTDARGHFTIQTLAAGTYQVRVASDWDLPPGSPDASRSVEATVVIGRSPPHVRLVAPRRSGTIAGTVSDPRGAPQADVYVTVALEPEPYTGPRYLAWQAKVLTGVDGSFELTELPRGRFALRAYRDGGAEAVLEHVEVGERAARIIVRPTGSISGAVVPTAHGRATDDVTIFAEDPARSVSREERLYRTGGQFALRELPAGTYKLTVNNDPRSAATVVLAEGQQLANVRLVARPRYSIRGRLLAADRTPLRGWKVEAPRHESTHTTPDGRSVIVSTTELAITTPDGRFLLHDLPAGLLTISAGDVSRSADAPLQQLRELTLQGPTDVDVGDLVVQQAAE